MVKEAGKTTFTFFYILVYGPVNVVVEQEVVALEAVPTASTHVTQSQMMVWKTENGKVYNWLNIDVQRSYNEAPMINQSKEKVVSSLTFYFCTFFRIKELHLT